MGRVSHQDFFSFDNHGCLCDDLMGDEDDCCSDEVEVVAIEEDQQFHALAITITPKLNILFSFELPSEADVGRQRQADENFYHHPPPKEQPIYLLYQSYTFYG